MGDRVSVSFRNGDDESVALFDHWGGAEFALEARDYARDFIREMKIERATRSGSDPHTRLEPAVLMVDFIARVARRSPKSRSDRVSYALYLGKDSHDGDNSDNGHHVIDLMELAAKEGYQP